MIQSFQLVRDQSCKKIWYKYTCCKIPYPCHQRIKRTHFAYFKNGETASLYKQDVQCANDDFMTYFKFTEEIGYMYKCCNTSDRKKDETPSNDNGNHQMHYLDRHSISCENGYGLAKFHLIESSHDQYQYNFRCTKILTTCAAQGKKHL